MKIKCLIDFGWTYSYNNDIPPLVTMFKHENGAYVLNAVEGQIIDLGPDFIAQSSQQTIACWYYQGLISFIDDDGVEHVHDPKVVIEKPEVKLPRKKREVEL